LKKKNAGRKAKGWRMVQLCIRNLIFSAKRWSHAKKGAEREKSYVVRGRTIFFSTKVRPSDMDPFGKEENHAE